MAGRTRIRRFLHATALSFVVAAWGCGGNPSPGPVYVVREPPPRPRREVIVVRPGRGYAYIAGRWDWRGGGWQWVPGRWERVPPRYHSWAPGHWARTRGGWYWIEGHWR
jgi:hypothetical protein